MQGDAPQEVHPPGYLRPSPRRGGRRPGTLPPGAPPPALSPWLWARNPRAQEGPGGLPGVSQRPAQRQQLVEPDLSTLRRLDVPRRVAGPRQRRGPRRRRRALSRGQQRSSQACPSPSARARTRSGQSVPARRRPGSGSPARARASHHCSAARRLSCSASIRSSHSGVASSERGGSTGLGRRTRVGAPPPGPGSSGRATRGRRAPPRRTSSCSRANSRIVSSITRRGARAPAPLPGAGAAAATRLAGVAGPPGAGGSCPAAREQRQGPQAGVAGRAPRPPSATPSDGRPGTSQATARPRGCSPRRRRPGGGRGSARRVGEQVVAPGDGPRAGSGGGRARRAGPPVSSGQAPLQAAPAAPRREQGDAGRRQLDGQGQPVQAPADARPRRGRSPRSARSRAAAAWARATKRRTASLRSRPAGAAGPAGAGGSGSARGGTSRRCSPARRSGGPAGGQHRQAGGVGQEARRPPARAGEQVLEVVQDQQQAPARAGAAAAGRGTVAPARLRAPPAPARSRPATSAGAVERRQGHEARPRPRTAAGVARRRASSSARRVLPIPGGPSRVSRRTSARSKRRWARCSSSSRPTRGVRGQGTPEPGPGEVLIPGRRPQQSPRYSPRARRATRGALHGGAAVPLHPPGLGTSCPGRSGTFLDGAPARRSSSVGRWTPPWRGPGALAVTLSPALLAAAPRPPSSRRVRRRCCTSPGGGRHGDPPRPGHRPRGGGAPAAGHLAVRRSSPGPGRRPGGVYRDGPGGAGEPRPSGPRVMEGPRPSAGGGLRADILLAGDGGRYAVVGHTAPASAGPGQGVGCLLAVFDLAAVPRPRLLSVCAPGESRLGLAVESDPAGTVIYAGLWRTRSRRRAGRGRWGPQAGAPGRGAIVALDARDRRRPGPGAAGRGPGSPLERPRAGRPGAAPVLRRGCARAGGAVPGGRTVAPARTAPGDAQSREHPASARRPPRSRRGARRGRRLRPRRPLRRAAPGLPHRDGRPTWRRCRDRAPGASPSPNAGSTFRTPWGAPCGRSTARAVAWCRPSSRVAGPSRWP